MDDCQAIRKNLIHQHLELLPKQESDAICAHVARCSACLKAFDDVGADFAAFKRLERLLEQLAKNP